MSALIDYTRIAWKDTVGILADYYGDYAQAQGPVGHDSVPSAIRADHRKALSGR